MSRWALNYNSALAILRPNEKIIVRLTDNKNKSLKPSGLKAFKFKCITSLWISFNMIMNISIEKQKTYFSMKKTDLWKAVIAKCRVTEKTTSKLKDHIRVKGCTCNSWSCFRVVSIKLSPLCKVDSCNSFIHWPLFSVQTCLRHKGGKKRLWRILFRNCKLKTTEHLLFWCILLEVQSKLTSGWCLLLVRLTR